MEFYKKKKKDLQINGIQLTGDFHENASLRSY